MSYLISDTTRDQRQKLFNEALSISLLGTDKPTDEDMLLFQQYIDGLLELDEIKKMIVDKYSKEAATEY